MRPIDRVFGRLGLDKVPGWATIRTTIANTAASAYPAVKARWGAHGGAAGAVVAAAAIYELYRAGKIAQKWDEAKAMASDGLNGMICNWLEDATGVRPDGLTREALEAYAGKLVAADINSKAGTNFASVLPANAFIADMRGRVMDEIKAGGLAGKLPIIQPYASSLQMSIGQAYNKAMRLPVAGAALALVQDQKKLKNRVRQARWRERNRVHYSYWNKHAEVNAILLAEIRAYNAAMGRPVDHGIPAAVLNPPV